MPRNLTRRAFLYSAALGAGGVAIVSCTPKATAPTQAAEPAKAVAGATSAPTKAPTATPIVSVSGSGKTVIEYWNGLTGEDGVTEIKICQQFIDKNPDISVKMQRIPWGNYFDKLMAAIVANAGPDMFILHSGEYHEWQPKGVLMNLDDIYDTGMVPKDQFVPRVMEDLVREGHLYTVPKDAYLPVLWLNLNIFDKFGVPYDKDKGPMTRQEFLDIATKLTVDKNGKHPNESGFDPTNVEIWGFAGGNTVGTTARQNGVDRVSMDGTCKATVTEEGYVEALTFERDLSWKYNVKPRGSDFNASQGLGAGRLAIFYNGSWFYNWWKQHTDLKNAVWPYPAWGKEKGVWSDSHCLCLPTELKDPKLSICKKLIAHISDSPLWSAEAGMPTARMDIAKDPSIQSNWALPIELKQQEYIQKPNRTYTCGTEISGVLNPEIAAALNNEKEPLKAMQDAAARMQQALDRCCLKK